MFNPGYITLITLRDPRPVHAIRLIKTVNLVKFVELDEDFGTAVHIKNGSEVSKLSGFIGSQVRITGGAFAKFTGTLRGVQSGFIMVGISILGRIVTVKVNPEDFRFIKTDD